MNLWIIASYEAIGPANILDIECKINEYRNYFRRDRYLSDFSIKTLQDRNLVGGEGSPQQAFARFGGCLQ